MARPWDHPGEHHEVSEEVFLLRHLVNAVAAIGREMDENQENIMAAIDGITAAVADLGAAVTDAQGRISAADTAAQANAATLSGQVTDLQAQVDTLTANAVDQAELDALASSVAAIAATVRAIGTTPAPVEPPVI
jgi:multidrug resistance efflux pump